MTIKQFYPNAGSSFMIDNRGIGYHASDVYSFYSSVSPDFVRFIVSRLAESEPELIDELDLFNVVKSTCDVNYGFKRYTITQSFFVVYDQVLTQLKAKFGSWAPVYAIFVCRYLKALQLVDITVGQKPSIIDQNGGGVLALFDDNSAGLFDLAYLSAPVTEYVTDLDRDISTVVTSYSGGNAGYTRMGISTIVSAIQTGINRFIRMLRSIRIASLSDRRAVSRILKQVLAHPDTRFEVCQEEVKMLLSLGNTFLSDLPEAFEEPSLQDQHRCVRAVSNLKAAAADTRSLFELKPVADLVKLIDYCEIQSVGATPYSPAYGLVRWAGAETMLMQLARVEHYYGGFSTYTIDPETSSMLTWLSSVYSKIATALYDGWLLSYDSPYIRSDDVVQTTLSKENPYGADLSEKFLKIIATGLATDLSWSGTGPITFKYRALDLLGSAIGSATYAPSLSATQSAEIVVTNMVPHVRNTESAVKQPLLLTVAAQTKAPATDYSNVKASVLPSTFTKLDVALSSDTQELAAVTVPITIMPIDGSGRTVKWNVPLDQLVSPFGSMAKNKVLEVADVTVQFSNTLATAITEIVSSPASIRRQALLETIFGVIRDGANAQIRSFVAASLRSLQIIDIDIIDKNTDRAVAAVLAYNVVHIVGQVYTALGCVNLGEAIGELADAVIKTSSHLVVAGGN